MKTQFIQRSPHQRWAEFRFGVIGGLLSDLPAKGELHSRLLTLAQTQWTHPVTGGKITIALSTIERWYYASLKQDQDPLKALRRKMRRDSGSTRQFTVEVKSWLQTNYRAHPSWSGQLHSDNLKVWLEENPIFGSSPSYPSIIRYMRSRGWNKKARVRSPFAPGRVAAAHRLESREVRSFEVEYVGGLWHLDFHHASRPIRTERGELYTPLALCILDDHSRLCCHIQWYFHEDTHSLVHGFTQALQKRGLCRALMSDNGSAMTSAEFTQGLLRLGISHETTLAYSPYQNGKQESFWGILEGRMMAMLEGVGDLTLEELNRVSQAWAEMEYNRRVHSETHCKPVDRWINGKSVMRPAPERDELIRSFRRDEPRTQRRSDGSVSILGKRFEIPNAYRGLAKLVIRYAEWDLRQVHLIDPRTQALLTPLYPMDRLSNAAGLRRRLGSNLENKASNLSPNESGELPPLLQKLVSEYAASGLPPAYLVDSEGEKKEIHTQNRDQNFILKTEMTQNLEERIQS